MCVGWARVYEELLQGENESVQDFQVEFKARLELTNSGGM